jgi:hypothetical protein
MFNGSVLNFASAPVARVVGLSYRTGGAWVDVTEPADVNKLFEIGQTDLSLSVKFKRHCALTFKAKGTVSITWADGTTTSAPGTWQVGPIDDSGDWDAPITGTVELRPTVPDA